MSLPECEPMYLNLQATALELDLHASDANVMNVSFCVRKPVVEVVTFNGEVVTYNGEPVYVLVQG